MHPGSLWVGSTSASKACLASPSLPGLALKAPTTMTSGMLSPLAQKRLRNIAASAPARERGIEVAQINHVSVNALNLEESVRFYEELLGARPIETPNFGIPVQWLALGRTQLHLFERDIKPTSHHHFAITVDDIDPVYRAAERRNAFDYEAFGNNLVELPGDVVQLYVRDPAGNLVEIDHHGVARLADDLRAQLKGLWDFHPQSEENMRGRLFV